ncbi:hypothetical protein GCK32_000952 [Trichostrongylus colubriformis]|uniref:Uncharacterized protein n=1 Tax=Trichostrongylus colubriformis TaxID=6319 RepID=A0AAN8FVA7_TRICO
MLLYSLLASVSVIASHIGAVFRGECDISRPVPPFAKNGTHNHCVRINVIKAGELDANWNVICGQFSAPHGVSTVLDVQGCRRYSAKGVYFMPKQNVLEITKLHVGEILECHCFGNACGVVFATGIMKALDDSTHSVLKEDIKCIKQQVIAQLPRPIGPPQRTRPPQLPPHPPPPQPPPRPPPWPPLPTRIPRTTARRRNVTTWKIQTTRRQAPKQQTTAISSRTVAKATTTKSKEMKSNATAEVTEDELVRKLSLHLLMFSTAMSTLMVCQLTLLTKLRNFYRNPSPQPSKKKSRKGSLKSKSPASSTKSPASSAPSSPTKDYFKP